MTSRVARVATENDAWVLTDEIYSRLVYPAEDGTPGSAPSVFSIPGMRDRTVLVDGFSKTYCMTGWRLGWAVMPSALARRVELPWCTPLGAPRRSRKRRLAALVGPQEGVDAMVEEYRRRRISSWAL